MVASLDIPTPSEELMRRYDVAGPRYTSHPTAPEWKRELGTEHHGLVRREGSQLEVTPLGRLFVRHVARVFDAYLRHAERSRFSRTV